MKRENKFQGKVAWITGASSGIGEELADQLNQQGAKLILSSNEAGELQRVRKKCVRSDDSIMVLDLDLSG